MLTSPLKSKRKIKINLNPNTYNDEGYYSPFTKPQPHLVKLVWVQRPVKEGKSSVSTF